jgi:hypothetical protein
MNTLTLKTNLQSSSCLTKISPFLDGNAHIQNWNVQFEHADKILTVQGDATESEVIDLMAQAGFVAQKNDMTNFGIQSSAPAMPAMPAMPASGFWNDILVWKKASYNTLNCLVGCSIGDFGMIIFLQAYFHHIGMAWMMLWAILAGLTTSILLESILLRIKEKLSWVQSFQFAFRMSILSMVVMEIAMNVSDFLITGGKANFNSPTYWMAFGVAAVAGFLVPLPYNYFKLKKYNKSCH